MLCPSFAAGIIYFTNAELLFAFEPLQMLIDFMKFVFKLMQLMIELLLFVFEGLRMVFELISLASEKLKLSIATMEMVFAAL